MSADTSADVSHVQDEEVLRKMWQDTEDFGKKKEIRSHMYKLREERLRNFYSSTDSSEIQRAQSTPGLHDKPLKEGNGPTHADSLADHSFLSLKSKEIRDSESPTREMHYRVDKTRGADQGWNVVTKNESSPDGKTHTTSRVATTSGTDKIEGGVANYAAKCEQQASVFNDGDDKNFTKSMATSSRNVIQQEAKGGDDNSNFQSFSKSSSSSSKVVSQHHATSGDTTNFKALPSSNIDDSSTVIRKIYTTNVPAELKNNPNYIDANTKVTTETRTLPDGSRVTTTRYETRGAKTVSTSSTDHHATSSKVSEQKSSTVKSSSSKSETLHSNKMIQDNRNVHDDIDRTRIINQTDNTQIIRQVPVTVSIINDDVNKNVSQSINKTSSSSVNIQKSHKVVDSRNIDIKSDHFVQQTKDIHDTRKDIVNKTQDVERNVDIRQEFTTTKDNVVKTHKSEDIHGVHQDDVRTIRLIQENEYLPRDIQPENRSTTTVRQEVITTRDGTVKKTTQDVRGGKTHHHIVKTVEEQVCPREPDFVQPKDISTTTVRKETTTRGGTQDDVRVTRIIQENDQPDFDRPGHQEIVTTRREVITTNKSENIPQDDVHIMKIIQENEYLPRGTQPGDRTPIGRGPGDRTPVPSTPGDRTPIGRTPGDRTPAVSTPGDCTPIGRTPGDHPPVIQEVVRHLIPHQEQPKPQDICESFTTTKTTTTTVDKTGHSTDDFYNQQRIHIIDTKPDEKEPSPRPKPIEPSPNYEKPKSGSPKYETPEKREPIRPGKSELDQKTTPTDGQYDTTYRTDYVNKRISVDVSPTHDAFARSLRAITPDRDKKRGSTRSLKSSTSSLRSSTSPEKYPTGRQPGRVSPDRKPRPESRETSPRKTSPTKQTPNGSINTDTITRRRNNETTTVSKYSPERKTSYDTITRTKHTTGVDTRHHVTKTTDVKEIDSSTLTRRPKTHRPRSRSTSPTSIASDIEFVKSSEIITDLDDETIDTRRDITKTQHTTKTEKRPTSLTVTTTKTRKITDRSPTSPLTDFSSPGKKSPAKDKPFKRRDTYEDRCRLILGITDNVTEVRKTTKKVETTPTKPSTRTPSNSPEKIRSPTKEIHEFPSQIRRSPEKHPLEKVPRKTSPTKEGPKIQEFPSQIRRSPEKQPLQKPSEKCRPLKEKPKVAEFPSQIRRSPEKQPLEKPSEKPRPGSYVTKIQEFPSQIRRSPEKQPLEKPGEKSRPIKEGPKVQEFPSQIRRSPDKQPEKNRVDEYPSQVKKIPGLGKAPGNVDEPLFTKKFISTLCRDEEVERKTSSRSPERNLPQDYVTPSDTDSDRPHKTVKKDSPEKTYPSQRGPKEPVSKFIDTERIDTDITISEYDKETRRVSTERKPITKTTTTNVTEYTDEYSTPEGYKPFKPDRKSPTRIPVGSDRVSPDRKIVTETEKRTTKYTDEFNVTEKGRPIKPERTSPTRYPGDSGTTNVTEYTDEYTKIIQSDDDKPAERKPARSPDRKSPERIRGVTEYTDEYRSTDKREKTTTGVVKTTRKFPKPGDDEETTDSEEENTTRRTIIKETVTTNGNIPKRTTSPSKSGTKPGITEYPSQKPKSCRTIPTKTTKTTLITSRKDKYDVENVYNVHVDNKVHDSYTKTTKTLTNGDIPKNKTIPKPKSTRPGITEYPSQKSPERKKPLTEKPGKPKQPGTTKIVCSPRSPERYSPSKQVTDKEKTHTTTITRKIATKTDTYKSKTPTKPTQRQPEQQPSTKRHVVTTTIQVTPKGPRKPTVPQTTRLSQPKSTKPRKPSENSRGTTEEDSETDYEEVTDSRRVIEDHTTRRTDSKITRTTSDQIIKTPQRVPVRGQSKPELLTSPRPSTRSGKKVITTKSITINNDFDTEKEIIVNLQRSTSSREATPDRIYPRPASEDEDTGIPRYPDQISEPDEPRTRRKPTKLSDIPIIESEDTQHFTRVTEHEDKETRRVNKVEKTDECLLSVNQKVSKFVDEAEKLTKKKPLSPTRKSPRPDETTTDRGYRNVTEKFVNTTEHLTTGQRIPERPKSPKCKNYPDEEVDDQEQFSSVSKKVSHFIETAEKVKHPQKSGPAPKIKRPEFTEVHENIRTDDCLLSVSDKVSKFTTVTKLQSPDYKKPVSLAKIDITPKRESPTRDIPSPRRESPLRESPRRESPRRESPRTEIPAPRRESPRRESPRREIPSPRRESPRRESPRREITTDCVQIDSEEQTYIRRPSPERYSPIRRTSSPRPYRDDKTPTRTSYKSTETQQSKYVRKDSSMTEPDSTPKSSRKDDEPRSVLSPTGRLRSTESIRKAKELFENIAKEQKTTKQRDIINRPSVFEGKKPKQPVDDRCTIKTTKEDVKLTDIGVYNIKTSDNKTRNINTKLMYSSDEELRTIDSTRKTITNTYNKDDHFKSTRLVMDKLHRPRSPEKEGDTPGYLRPLDRSPHPHSPYYDRSRSPRPESESPSRDRSPRPHDPNLDEIPHYMWPLDRTQRDYSSDRSRSQSREPTPDLHGKLRSRASTPDKNIPGYMKPLDRHVRPSSPHRKSTNELDGGVPKRHSIDDTEKTTKFGVTLRRTDSGRVVTTSTTTHRRKLTTVEIERILTSHELEEIYDIEVLEVLLERAFNYEQRRRIRSQIRIVKQLIAENKLTKKTTKTVSPTRGKSPEKPRPSDKSRTEYQTEYIRKVSPSRKIDNKHFQHTDIVTKRSDVERKSEYQTSYAYNERHERRTSSEVKTLRGSSPETKIIRGKSPEKAPRRSITTVETVTRRSPERKTEKTESKSVYKTELRRTAPVTKTVVEEKPSWVTQRALKKPTDGVPSRKTTTTSSTTKKQTRTSPTKECKPTDVITSSYGVGPTDENGTPLFGLRALRAQNRTDTTKVQGTVIRSHYYSENGQEPTGEVSVTKYSTDPRDLDGHVEDRNGLVSVTTTQKFGSKGTPSYKTIIDKKQITDLDDEECETVTRKSSTTKVSRRGSVKEMSKKFIENAVETTKNERQSSYPKAGLILRTSSFKDTAKSGSSRESSPEKQESVSRTVTVKKSTTSSSSKARADTFLNNKTRVRGVQDVITRMKNSEGDVQAGDSLEDQEARTLLNKFIGSQVILSGMETRTSSSSTPTTVKRTTTTTSTSSKGGGKPTVITRTFTHPITEAEISTVWDEQTLKLLLERSTDYEERQTIRSRIHEVMAEQEVCADVVAKSKEETNSGRIEEKVETSKTTFTESPVTTTQVTTRVTSQQQVTKKPISPFAKFRQLDKQNSINTPPGTPRTPTGSRPLFKFTDPELSRQASTVKERLLQWCQMKTKEYENISLDNFSGSWADGLAFCALIHHFLPDAFDYQALTPKERRHNFTLAFRIADEKADILPLLDVDDMVATRKPDWKCVFTYVQTIYARFKNED